MRRSVILERIQKAYDSMIGHPYMTLVLSTRIFLLDVKVSDFVNAIEKEFGIF